MSIHLTSDKAEGYNALLDRFDTWLFDCDGVLWHGDTVIDGAVEVLQLLRSRKKSVVFVTNNATKSRNNYIKKFEKLGIEAHVDEIFSSAYASAIYISSVLKLPKDQKVYVVGMSGLEEELREEGISFIGGSAEKHVADIPAVSPDPSIGAVVVGLDININYTKLTKAFRYLHSNPSCAFIATNEDTTYPSDKGLLPGAGAILAPLKTALGAGRPVTAIGKPNSVMLDCIKAKHNFDPQRTIMVGDRLDTDILFGKSGGLTTLLVLTGIISEADLTGPNASKVVPDFVARSIGDFRVARNA